MHPLPPDIDQALAHAMPGAFARELRPRLTAGLRGPYRCAPIADPNLEGVDQAQESHPPTWSVAGRLSWHHARTRTIVNPGLLDALLREDPGVLAWAPGVPEAQQDALWIWVAAARDARATPNRISIASVAERLLQGEGPPRAERVEALGRALARAFVLSGTAFRHRGADTLEYEVADPMGSVVEALFSVAPRRHAQPPPGSVGASVLSALPDQRERLACLGQALGGWRGALMGPLTYRAESRLLARSVPRALQEPEASAWHAWMAPQAAMWVDALWAALHPTASPPAGGEKLAAHVLGWLLRSGHAPALTAIGGAAQVLARIDEGTVAHWCLVTHSRDVWAGLRSQALAEGLTAARPWHPRPRL